MSEAKTIGLINENTANGALNGSYAEIMVGKKSFKFDIAYFLYTSD